jgi:hypothetical protein
VSDNEIIVKPVVHDGEALPPFDDMTTEWVRRICSVLQIPAQLIGTPNSNIYTPTGAVIEGTLAEKDEEDR